MRSRSRRQHVSCNYLDDVVEVASGVGGDGEGGVALELPIHQELNQVSPLCQVAHVLHKYVPYRAIVQLHLPFPRRVCETTHDFYTMWDILWVFRIPLEGNVVPFKLHHSQVALLHCVASVVFLNHHCCFIPLPLNQSYQIRQFHSPLLLSLANQVLHYYDRFGYLFLKYSYEILLLDELLSAGLSVDGLQLN